MPGGRISASRKRASHWVQSLKPVTGGSIGALSSRGSVDSVFIEDFPDSNSGSSHSARGPREGSRKGSHGSDSEISVEPEAKWRLRLVNSALRPLVKRRAKRLVIDLINANDQDGPSARHQRRKAARALLDLAEKEREGVDIVARRFVKTSSRRREGILALFKLSDEEVDDLQNGVSPAITEPTISIQLLDLIVEATKESLFVKTLISLMRGGTDGAAAVLHFATSVDGFFSNIDPTHILDFGSRVVKKEKILSTKWFSGLSLLVATIEHTSPDRFSHLAGTLHITLSNAIEGVVEQGDRASTGVVVKERKSRLRELPVLSLVARCCAGSEPVLDLLQFALPPTSTLTSFIATTLSIAQNGDFGQCRFSLEGGFALMALAFLLQIPTVVQYAPVAHLHAVGRLFVGIALHSRALEIQKDDSSDEKDILRWLRAKLDQGIINALSRLPELNFKEALASALESAHVKFKPPVANPYEPLEIVERLLWLSNLKRNTEEVHYALVEASACTFLVHVLSYTGGFKPQDRGVWRAKGLAMTCLGNIVEMMDWVQLRDHITAGMIEVIVKIKVNGETPTVQKGQAIFLLQRYTVVADRYGIEPHYREDTSNMVTDLWSTGID